MTTRGAKCCLGLSKGLATAMTDQRCRYTPSTKQSNNQPPNHFPYVSTTAKPQLRSKSWSGGMRGAIRPPEGLQGVLDIMAKYCIILQISADTSSRTFRRPSPSLTIAHHRSPSRALAPTRIHRKPITASHRPMDSSRVERLWCQRGPLSTPLESKHNARAEQAQNRHTPEQQK